MTFCSSFLLRKTCLHFSVAMESAGIFIVFASSIPEYKEMNVSEVKESLRQISDS